MIVSLLAILILLVVFIRSPWGQSIVVKKATTYVSDKTNTVVSIDKLYLTFSGNLFLEGLYLEDMDGDTLLYSRKLEAGVEVVPLIKTGEINVTKLEWEGLKADISRTELTGKFNFDFLIEAFNTQDGEAQIQEDTLAQTEAQPLSITLSPISLKDFDLRYVDEILGIDAFLIIESLEMEIPVLDLGNSEYRISNFSLQNSKISYTQTKPFEPTEEDTVEAVLPSLIVDKLQLSNISATYNNTVDRQRAGLDIGQFTFQAPEIDLQNQQINVSSIKLLDSNILFHDFGVEVATVPEAVSEPVPFAWPDWAVQVANISLANNSVEFKTADQQTMLGYFNPEVLAIQDLRLEAGDIFLEDNQASLTLSEAGFVEAGGFELKNLQFDFSISEENSELNELWIETNRSQLKGIATV
ncbi:MAG TPA: hypothetical protein VLA71_09710, partial [Algoriphagus sp.]|nr:hypothetical protein [Algoriphagus sp.]